MTIEFYRHALGPDELDAAVKTLGTLFLTTGEKNREFERRFADYLGVSETVTTSSCTAALHLALAALGIGAGDQVITTPMSFIATANAILMTGATPVFVDVDSRTGLIDLDLVESAISSRTKAIIPVHLYGQMVDMRRLRGIADRHGLFVIEDAAHAIEARRDGVRPGQLGDAACFSFYATKNITCGEGGALATNNADLAESIHLLRNHGMSRSAAARYTGRYQHWDMERLGWKYNLTNFQAAMLIPQLERIEALWQRRDAIARRYESALSQAGVEFPEVLPGDNKSARHLFTIWVDEDKRDDAMCELQNAGVGIAVNYRPIHLTAFYRQRFGHQPGEYRRAERVGTRTISLPCYPGLSEDETAHVIASVVRVCAKQQDVQV
jgi:UDP-4-amino-4-deoxy-L-arabinose-oxoglutarate aminotransferase